MGSSQHETTLGVLLKQRRTELGLSLYELAKRTGINRSNLMRLEDGVIGQPRNLEALNTLALALEVEPEELYDAVWQDSNEPLPSPAIYFRSKYQLSDNQIQELKSTFERITEDDNS